MANPSVDRSEGPQRARLGVEEAARLRQSGALVMDSRRERPRWFDGRFLAARDLVREQDYFLTREADLGRAAGSGVASGLHVQPSDDGLALFLSAGEGLTPGGELVMLQADLRVNLADIAHSQALSARLGLGQLPVAPARTRSGLFVLGLRPVEFTANPVGAYPTTLTGARTVEDGDVIEATAVVLIPWEQDGSNATLAERRAQAARALFVQEAAGLLARDVLPLAMLALSGNHIEWLDEALMRRELGQDRADMPGLGLAPRGLRLAHLLQYQEHLAAVVDELGGRPFSAASRFQALPPAGPLPQGVIATGDWTQAYFPAVVDVDFSVIPEDELPALVEEAMSLPPIDLLAGEVALDLTAVLVLAPVPRAQFRAVTAALQSASRTRTLKPAAANLVAQRKPLEILQRLRLPAPIDVSDVPTVADAEWARLAQLPNLWYVRRRNLAYRDDLAGAPVSITVQVNDEPMGVMRTRLQGLGLSRALDAVLARSTVHAAPQVVDLLNAPKVASSPALTAATLGALRAHSGPIDRAGVMALAGELHGSATGTGLARLEGARGQALPAAALQKLASGEQWRALDASAAAAQAQALPGLAARLVPARKPAAKPQDAAAPEMAVAPQPVVAPRKSRAKTGPAASAKAARRPPAARNPK